jgi:GPH family glycoside/pentoside/hexuronide:cation symporter
MIWLPIVLAIVGMWVISKYPLSDAEVDKINHEIEDRRQTEEK